MDWVVSEKQMGESNRALSLTAVYHYIVDIITWNKDTRRGTFSVVLADESGNKAESKVNP